MVNKRLSNTRNVNILQAFIVEHDRHLLQFQTNEAQKILFAEQFFPHLHFMVN